MPEQAKTGPDSGLESRPEIAALLGLQPQEIGIIQDRGLEITTLAELGGTTIRIRVMSPTFLQAWANHPARIQVGREIYKVQLDSNGTAEIRISETQMPVRLARPLN